MKVLVCGGRDYADYARVIAELDQYHISALAEGGHRVRERGKTIYTRSADALAYRYAAFRGIPTSTYCAKWRELGYAAGPIRNQQMLDDFQPELVVAFPGGTGTADMVRRAKAANIPVHEVEP